MLNIRYNYSLGGDSDISFNDGFINKLEDGDTWTFLGFHEYSWNSTYNKRIRQRKIHSSFDSSQIFIETWEIFLQENSVSGPECKEEGIPKSRKKCEIMN